MSTRKLDTVRGVEDNRTACFTHDRQTAHVGNQIVVTEGGAALTNHEVVSAVIYLACFGDDIFHVARRQKLALLDIDRLAAGSHRMDEICLPTKESRGLQDINDGGDRRNLVNIVNVRQHRYANLALHFGKNAQTFVEAKTTDRGARTAIRLVVGSLENIRNFELTADFLHMPGNIQAKLLGFGRTWSRDQKKRMIKAGIEIAEFHLALAC